MGSDGRPEFRHLIDLRIRHSARRTIWVQVGVPFRFVLFRRVEFARICVLGIKGFACSTVDLYSKDSLIRCPLSAGVMVRKRKGSAEGRRVASQNHRAANLLPAILALCFRHRKGSVVCPYAVRKGMVQVIPRSSQGTANKRSLTTAETIPCPST